MRIQEAIDLNSWMWRFFWNMYGKGLYKRECFIPVAVREAVKGINDTFDKAEVVFE